MATARKLPSGFRNNNPDKGTETVLFLNLAQQDTIGLEIITPIRGRKLTGEITLPDFEGMFRNNNPDKGTETIKEIYMDNLITVFKFRNNNPDKGTETGLHVSDFDG